jgi:hypothetical protein
MQYRNIRILMQLQLIWSPRILGFVNFSVEHFVILHMTSHHISTLAPAEEWCLLGCYAMWLL